MTANADTFVGWLIVISVCAYIAADRLIVALAWWDRRNEECDRVEAADWEQHVADAVAPSETPIYAATAAHIAKHAAENIATEWAALNGESS